MAQAKFLEVARTAFAFLEEYGFRVIREQYDSEVFGNGLVEFRSPCVGVLVTLDRGQVLVNVGPVEAPADAWFSLSMLQEYCELEIGQRAVNFPEEWQTYDQMVVEQTQWVAGVLRQECACVLDSPGMAWDGLESLRSRHVEAKYKTLTGKSLPRP